jgi:hypothetical protein
MSGNRFGRGKKRALKAEIANLKGIIDLKNERIREMNITMGGTVSVPIDKIQSLHVNREYTERELLWLRERSNKENILEVLKDEVSKMMVHKLVKDGIIKFTDDHNVMRSELTVILPDALLRNVT